ncbi:hypothetical protein [Caballeronia sp. GAWG2-1]|uniref:hypothetical protein n=1 Tax=Caballeronia sp. GAWG2-1 TaxID=2921744 RepID=UPI0020284D18|nr:hypothetical protein [Caballeronia sp. GAWG2-1]
MSETGALAYWFDIAPSVTGEWLDWYLQDHMPSRVGTTFVAGRCYEALGATSSHMVLFETATPEALLAPSYLELLKQVSDEDRQRRSWYSNPIRVICRVVGRSGRGTGSVLGVLRITDSQGASDEMIRATLNELLAAGRKVKGIGSAWVLQNDNSMRIRMDEARVTGHQDGSADWAILIEGGHQGDVEKALDLFEGIQAWRSLELGDAVTRGVYRLLYTMSQSDQAGI